MLNFYYCCLIHKLSKVIHGLVSRVLLVEGVGEDVLDRQFSEHIAKGNLIKICIKLQP